MNKLYKTTLLITMAVVTWKVWKIESNTKNKTLKISSNQISKKLGERRFVNIY
ncbi:hypothetical protein [Staphylococcus equorum]|uniref:hypothetical protein n=1 Tax=Staphylococcus equorum TaxID=246432 RepID=UPI00397FD86F